MLRVLACSALIALLGVLLLPRSGQSLSMEQAAEIFGGETLSDRICQPTSDCHALNVVAGNIRECPSETGCEECEFDDRTLSSCVPLQHFGCNYYGPNSRDCGRIYTGTCNEGVCEELILIPGSFCTDGPSCEGF